MNTLPHPSIFESKLLAQTDTRTLQNIQKQRSQKLITDMSEIGNLPNSNKHPLTLNDKQISQNNTKQVFKNIYDNTLLTEMYFSKQNIQNIQNIIKYLVHKETNYVVDDQSYTELLIVMRSIFLEYSAHPPYIHNDMSQSAKNELYKKYTIEVDRLNQIVVNSIVPKIISQLQQYIDYLKDASTQPTQIERPQNESIAGQRQYRSITQVLIGGNL